jgi:hypothetical protein
MKSTTTSVLTAFAPVGKKSAGGLLLTNAQGEFEIRNRLFTTSLVTLFSFWAGITISFQVGSLVKEIGSRSKR